MWNQELIADGQRLVRSCLQRNQPGPFQIQAAIAAVHADAPTADATDWTQIVALYDQLYEQTPNPVVGLSRAIAISELHGLAEGLAALDADRLADYQPYHATRADLLARSGRTNEAIDAYNRAIELTTNPTEHRFLIKQRAGAENSSPG